MADTQITLNALMLPLHEVYLVLPQSTVAEVMRAPGVAPIDGSANWLMGTFPWRGQPTPVVSFEDLSGYPRAAVTNETRVAVIYALEKLPGLAFYAVRVQGIPRPVRIGPEAVTPDEGRVHTSPLIARHVLIGGQKSLIPDLALAEEMIRAQLENLKNESQ